MFNFEKTKVIIFLFFLIFSISTLYPQVQVKYELISISFKGNNHFSLSTLLDVIKSKETPSGISKFFNSFSPLGAPPVYFDSSLISIDTSALKSFYKTNGFFLVNVSPHYSLNKPNQTAKIVYTIVESSPFNINNIIFYGLESVPSDVHKKITSGSSIKNLERYSESQVEDVINELISVLDENGYMKASLDSTLIFIDTLKKNVNVDIYVKSGKRYKVDEIVVQKRGESKNEVSENLIRDLTDFEKYEFLNSSKLQTNQRRLYRTEIFNNVSIQPKIIDTTSDLASLIIRGDIGALNQLSPEILGNDLLGNFNVGLGLTYKRKNFLGGARLLGINVEGLLIDAFNFNYKDFFKSQKSRDSTFQGQINASINLRQPYLFEKTISAYFESYYKSYTLKKNIETELGFKTSLNFEMKPYTFVNALSPYINFEYAEAIPNLDIVNLELDVFSVTSAIGIELGSLKADNLLFPTSGYNLSFIIEGATSQTKIDLKGPALFNVLGIDKLSADERAWFYSIQTTASYYIPLSHKHTIVNGIKLKLGYIHTVEGSETLIPPNRTFFVGGASSLRGWNSRELLPRDTVQYFGITSGDILRGGTFLIEGSFELRDKFTENFGMVLFADYGNIWNNYESFNFSDVAIAAGTGFRFYTSIIPFRIDLGFKFYNPSNRKFIWNNWDPKFFNNIRFNFGIGEAF